MSGPGCETIFVTSIVGESQHVDVGRTALDQVGVDGRAERDRMPSGDHEKAPTLKSLPRVRCLPAAGAFIASSSSMVQRWTC